MVINPETAEMKLPAVPLSAGQGIQVEANKITTFCLIK